MKKTRILVFAKAPQARLAKTRLIPALGAAGAAQLAKQMLFHTLHEALVADIGTVELCVTPALAHGAWHGFAFPLGIVISDQGEGDLGARMARAARRSVAQGESVLLIGTDCVEMSAELLRQSHRALQDHETVIHGTVDGGYALLGLQRFSSLLFCDIPWSTENVARLTLERLDALGWSVHRGTLLHDVDEPQDLAYLPPNPLYGIHQNNGRLLIG